MKTFSLRVMLGVFLAFGLVRVSYGQTEQYYLSLDSIKGDSTDPNFKDQMVLTGFSFSITNTSGVGQGVGKAHPGDLVMSKFIDRASPVLGVSAATSRPYQKAVLSAVRSDKGQAVVYYTITLTDVHVDGVSQNGNSGFVSSNPTGKATEVVSLSYGEITWQFGSTKAGYNFLQNKVQDVQPNSNAEGVQASLLPKSTKQSEAVRASR